MKASALALKAVKSLAIDEEARIASARMAEEAGVKDPEASTRLYREWVNDLVPLYGRPSYQAAAKAPSPAFLHWLSARLSDPFHVTYRAHEDARAKHGDEVALLFSEVRWAQEVSWARRMRGSDNDRIVFLGELWLKAASRDPGKLFRGLVDQYAEDGLFDVAYRDSSFHVLSPAEILSGMVDDLYWRPLWLRFAEREFGKLVNEMPRGRLTILAQKVRESEWNERITRGRKTQLERLRRWPPSLMVGVLSTAHERGLSSDDVVLAEKTFFGDVETGHLDLSGPHPAWRTFLMRLDEVAELAPLPSDEERRRRIEAIEGLQPSWTDRLPEDFGKIGAAVHSNLLAWFDEIAKHGTRPAPMDPAVDYGLWLIENSSAKASEEPVKQGKDDPS